VTSISVRTEEVRGWLGRYERAWRAGDVEAIEALFTPDCDCRSHPFRAPDDIFEYTRKWFDAEEDVEPSFGEPVVDGDRAAVEYWAPMREDGLELTLAGCVMLRFAPDGRCSQLRDYWVTAPERQQPPPAGWGA
jgi:ketosteroid isomerase-like protein